LANGRDLWEGLTVASLGQAARLKVKSTCTASQGKTIVRAPAWTPLCIDTRPIFDGQQAIGAQDNLDISDKNLTRVQSSSLRGLPLHPRCKQKNYMDVRWTGD
jgi:hypothetical protein